MNRALGHDPPGAAPAATALAAGLIGCTDCGAACTPGRRPHPRCPRCGAGLVSRPALGLQPVWAWLAAGLLLYVPANLWPMLETRTLGRLQESTILGGVVDLVAHGSYGIAVIVFVASIAIPVAKFAAIATLAWAARRPRGTPLEPHLAHRLTHLYEVVERIGRWSMIDVFVVAVLAALVQLGFVAAIRPGAAAGCFALSVAFTMLAARSFDPRLLWDRLGHAGENGR